MNWWKPWGSPSRAASTPTEPQPVVALPTPVFWLFGKTGSGKSSLIRFLARTTDAEIGSGFRPRTQSTRRYDFPSPQMPVLSFLDTRGLGEAYYDPESDISALASESHVLLIVVKAMDHAQVPVLEPLRKIRAARPELKSLLVITTLHEGYPGQDHPAGEPLNEQGTLSPVFPADLVRSIEHQKSQFHGLYEDWVAVDFTPVDDGFRDPFYGGSRLIDVVCRLLPEAGAAQLAQLQELARREIGLPTTIDDVATNRVLAYSVGAAVAGAVPVPWVDIPAVVAIQGTMAWHIANLYDYDYSGSRIAQLVSAVSGQMLARQGIREVAKLIPYFGSVASAALAFATTYGLGRTMIWAIESERLGRLPTPQEFREHLARQATLARELWARTPHGVPRST